MAQVIKKQKSLYLAALKWVLLGFVVVITGRLLLSVNVFITIATLFAFPVILGKGINFLVGAVGEYLVTKEIKKFNDNYYLINDINLSGMQIDHTLVCPKGIITIETKTYFGKVFGNGNEKYWKQYINGVPIRRYSPIKQGRGHSVKLFKLLEQKGLNRRIDTIVVFAGSASVSVSPRPIPIINRKQLYEYLSRQKDVLNHDQILEYKDKIMEIINN